MGLYVSPPEHAVVLSVDEKSQIQALDCIQPGLPPKKERCGTMSGKPLGATTHDYRRNSTTARFAALDVLEGSAIGRCMQRHTHQEFIRFLNAIRTWAQPTSRPTSGSTTTRPTSTPRSSNGSAAQPLHADLGIPA